MNDAHINVGLNYQCPMCNAIYKSKNTISTHVYTNHPELKGIDFSQLVLKTAK